MKARGMNPTQFADEIGVQRSSISHILSGRNNPSLDIITKILNRFSDVDSNWLVLGKGSLVQKSEGKLIEEKNIEFSKPSETKLSDFSNSLFDDIQEEEPMKSNNNNIEDLQRKIELLERNRNIEEIANPINNIPNPIEDIPNLIEPLKPSIPSNPIVKNVEEVAINTIKQDDKKRITKVIIFYSDSTFEELTKN
ncbi:MAG: helix-turn-helix transcriptional regulator [Bacteroidales bacterium]